MRWFDYWLALAIGSLILAAAWVSTRPCMDFVDGHSCDLRLDFLQ